MTLQQQTRALLDLVEADRTRQCAQILGDAQARADALMAQARAEARARLRQVFDEQRRLGQEHVAAAQARLATQRRLHEHQRNAALLQRAWQQLPVEMQARWRDPAARAAWVAQVLTSARERLPRAPWRIVHAPDWPADERQALATSLAADRGAAPGFEGDATITAGLKVIVHGNVIDGTLAGLLADRSALAAQLLRRLEASR